MADVVSANGSTHSKKAHHPREKRPVEGLQRVEGFLEGPPEPSDPFAELPSVELTGIKLPANVMFGNAASSVMVETRYTSAIGNSGLVKRLRWMLHGGYVVLDVQVGEHTRYVVVTQSGMEGPVR